MQYLMLERSNFFVRGCCEGTHDVNAMHDDAAPWHTLQNSTAWGGTILVDVLIVSSGWEEIQTHMR